MSGISAGTGVGGGTLLGPFKPYAEHRHFDDLVEMAKGGLYIKISTAVGDIPQFWIRRAAPETTASNSEDAAYVAFKAVDIAMGTPQSVFQTLGVCSFLPEEMTEPRILCCTTGNLTNVRSPKRFAVTRKALLARDYMYSLVSRFTSYPVIATKRPVIRVLSYQLTASGLLASRWSAQWPY